MIKQAHLFVLLMVLPGATAAFAQEVPKPEKITYPMPEQVKTVMINKCYDCHYDGEKDEEAKAGLNFSTLDQLGKIKQLAVFSNIQKEIEKGAMPPKKFVTKYPKAALTKEEADLLIEWVKKESAALLKQ